MSDATGPSHPSSKARWLLAGTVACFIAAGGLLWAREGERLFTDGLVAAIARCF